MLSNTVYGFLDRLTKTSLPGFQLSDIPNFPYDEYNRNETRYSQAEQWYSGKALDETATINGKATDLYPVKINPLKSAVEKHTHFLFGEVQQDDRPLVGPRVLSPSDDKREVAQKAEDVLVQLWYENNGRSIQWENGANSQVYGGCIFQLIYDPTDPFRTIPLRIERIHPKYFVGIPYATDMWRLREAWIIKPITHAEALSMGVEIADSVDPWLIEHYTESVYDVWVNSQPAYYIKGDINRPLTGANEWGFVPIVYIPHIRITGFYGDNLIDVVTGLVKEINLRVADFGDAVSVDSHSYLGMRNVNGAPVVQQLAPGLYAVNVGSTPNITGQDAQPDIFELRKPSASTPMEDLVLMLYDMYRRLAYIPAVVDGEDEGSQRSGLTLAMRMISLTAHTDTERIFWTSGIILLNRMALRMLAIKGEVEITIEHATLRQKLEWSPVLPRDRETVVNEAVALVGAKLGSPERLLQQLGVDDVDAEYKLIQEFWEWIAKVEAAAAPKPAPAKGKPAKKGLPGNSSSAQQGTKAKQENSSND